MFEQLVFSNLIPDILSWSTDAGCERGDSSCASPSSCSNEGHVPSLQVHKGRATEGNGLQVTGQKISEETEATRFLRISRVHASVDWSNSRECSRE